MSWPWPGIAPGEYAAISIDPPTKFKVYSEKGMGRSADRHYRTMTTEEILALPVRDLCARDTFVFLWTSGAHLVKALQMFAAWDITYCSTAFVWIKLNPHGHEMFWTRREFFKGQGYTTRKNAEFCLLGKVGSPKRQSTNVDELIIAPRRKHSQKPDETYSRIEQFAQGPYCELFSRKTRPGWQMFGNEVGKYGVAA